MKRIFALTLLGLVVAGGAAQAGPVGVSIGVFGGLTIPVLQDVSTSSFSPGDAFGATGSQFGIRVPVRAIPVITFEPYYAKSSYKDRDETIGGITYTREGFDGKSFGLNAILGRPDGSGFHFFPYIGLGKTKLERTGEEINKTGYNFGLGLGLSPAAKISVQARGEFAMVATGDTSRKFTNATLGLTYSLKP
ncbi:MAG: porin family protein [Candidatus Eisenbacteria bacterium]|uniref:Porin family protein n=1 Tax=Eiseniibacteriota bacterium TaxID=2212470 RepID=A0A538T454_UNCEI|nr:MAG: porin family protein [Candidatus Eisenbacteria bacterium]